MYLFIIQSLFFLEKHYSNSCSLFKQIMKTEKFKQKSKHSGLREDLLQPSDNRYQFQLL